MPWYVIDEIRKPPRAVESPHQDRETFIKENHFPLGTAVVGPLSAEEAEELKERWDGRTIRDP